MNLPIKSDRQIIMNHIVQFMAQFRIWNELQTEDVVKYCKRRMGRQVYPDTVIRYMRDMRSRGLINYTCVHKEKRKIKIIEIGEPHSI